MEMQMELDMQVQMEMEMEMEVQMQMQMQCCSLDGLRVLAAGACEETGGKQGRWKGEGEEARPGFEGRRGQ